MLRVTLGLVMLADGLALLQCSRFWLMLGKLMQQADVLGR